MPRPLGFTGARLDRADHLRTDAGAFAAAARDPRATCLAMDGIDPVPGERGGLIWETLDPADARPLLLLGIDEIGDESYIALPLSLYFSPSIQAADPQHQELNPIVLRLNTGQGGEELSDTFDRLQPSYEENYDIILIKAVSLSQSNQGFSIYLFRIEELAVHSMIADPDFVLRNPLTGQLPFHGLGYGYHQVCYL